MALLRIPLLVMLFQVALITGEGPQQWQDNNYPPSSFRQPRHHVSPDPFLKAPVVLYPESGNSSPSLQVLKPRGEDCCQPVMKEGLCLDGTFGTPFCGLPKGPDGGSSSSCNSDGCNCGGCRKGWYVTAYEHAEFKGRSVDIVGGSGCRNLEQEICLTKEVNHDRPENVTKCFYTNDWISSLDLHGTCVLVYENKGCAGRGQKIEDYDECHWDLGKCKFGEDFNWNDMISSIGPCK